MKGRGDKKEDIILFVHGAWHGAWCWEKYYMPFFANSGYDTYALIFRHHEKAGRVNGINKIKLNDYVEDLVMAVGQLEKAPIIIGHSMGGLVLQKYLVENSCNKAIFLAAVPPSGVFRLAIKLIFTTSYALFSLLVQDLFLLVNDINKVKWSFFSEDASNEDIQYCFNNLSSESYKAFLHMIYPNIKSTPYLQIPMLALGAEKDKFFTKEENEMIAKKYKADCMTLPNIAHDMMLDKNWQNAACYIKDWIEKIGA